MRIEIFVRDKETKRPIDGAQVKLFVQNQLVIENPTNQRGQFRHEQADQRLIGRTMTVEVHHNDYVHQTVERDIPADGLSLDVEMDNKGQPRPTPTPDESTFLQRIGGALAAFWGWCLGLIKKIPGWAAAGALLIAVLLVAALWYLMPTAQAECPANIDAQVNASAETLYGYGNGCVSRGEIEQAAQYFDLAARRGHVTALLRLGILHDPAALRYDVEADRVRPADGRRHQFREANIVEACWRYTEAAANNSAIAVDRLSELQDRLRDLADGGNAGARDCLVRVRQVLG